MTIKALINRSAIQAIAVLLIAAGNLYAADYYVSASGNDGNSGLSATAPWKTVAKVNTKTFNAGDRLFFQRGGTYNGGLILNQSSLTVDAYGSGNLPLFGGANHCIIVNGASITLQNVHTSGCFWTGIRILGAFTVVRLSEINGSGTGIDLFSNSNHITQNNIHDNNVYTTNACTSADSGADGVLVRGSHNELDHNQVSGSYAISCYYGTDGTGFSMWQGSYNFVHHNVTFGNQTFAELGTCCGLTPDNNVFAYNSVASTDIFLMTRGGSDPLFGPVLHTQAYNNSVYGAKTGVYCYGGCSPNILTLRNNLVYVIGGAPMAFYADGPVDEDYNIFYGGSVGSPLGAHSLYSDPGFANPAGSTLSLSGSSWAIGHGVGLGYTIDLAGSTVPQNGFVDMGAYEYGVAAVSAPSPAPVAMWTLSLSQFGNGTGTTTGSGVYPNGTVITLLATPALGSTFDGWLGGGICATGAVTMTADFGCAAVFTLLVTPQPLPPPVVTAPSAPQPVITVSSPPQSPSQSTPGTLSGITSSTQWLWVGKTGTLTVSLSSPATAAFPVALSSSAPTVAGVPATVTVPVGQTSASAAVTAWTTGTATITASADAASVQVTVQACVRHGNRCR